MSLGDMGFRFGVEGVGAACDLSFLVWGGCDIFESCFSTPNHDKPYSDNEPETLNPQQDKPETLTLRKELRTLSLPLHPDPHLNLKAVKSLSPNARNKRCFWA